MTSFFLRAASLLALALPLAASAATPTARRPESTKKATAPAPRSWVTTVSRTAEGAIVVGNPAAKVKLVEYLSLTCPHCADLSTQALPVLQRDYIAKGLVSFEVRHAVRDGYDFVASLLLRCEPPTQYLGAMESLFATQRDWMARGANAKTTPGFDELSTDQKMALAAKSAGFDGFFTKRGMTPKAYAACLADTKAKDQLTQMAANSWQRDGIPGTPLIVVNGKREEGVHGWSDLEPLLKAALK